MTTVTLNIRHWGNGLGVRLPASIAKAADLLADMAVSISVEDGRIIITPEREEALTLEQRLALFDSQEHGGEVMVPESSAGVEVW